MNSSSSTSESKLRTDVLTTPGSTNMSSLPPQIYPFRSKKPKIQPQKRNYVNIPAIEELRQSREKWRKDRADLFTIYGKNFHDFSFWAIIHRRDTFSCLCTELFLWHLDNLEHEIDHVTNSIEPLYFFSSLFAFCNFKS